MQDDEQTYRADDRGFTVDEETGLYETFDETQGEEVKMAKSAITDALSDRNALLSVKNAVLAVQ